MLTIQIRLANPQQANRPQYYREEDVKTIIEKRTSPHDTSAPNVCLEHVGSFH